MANITIFFEPRIKYELLVLTLSLFCRFYLLFLELTIITISLCVLFVYKHNTRQDGDKSH